MFLVDRVYFNGSRFEAVESDSTLDLVLKLERSSGKSNEVNVSIKTRDLQELDSAQGTYISTLCYTDV